MHPKRSTSKLNGELQLSDDAGAENVNILIASSEVVPFSKTGGLADVCGALPIELERLGYRTSLFTPAYRCVYEAGLPIEPTGIELEIPIGQNLVKGSLLKTRLPEGDTPVYLVQQDDYFDRPGIYSDNGTDYKDNCERYVFFCRAILESIAQLGLDVDLIHANDWPTALLPALLKVEYNQNPKYAEIASLFTIHNLAYQGQFWHWDMLLTGIDWKYFNYTQMEYHGGLNLMKTGLVFADSISTVSPRYSEEIQSSPHGCGLEGVLQHRRESLSGILNGIDTTLWNPATDDLLTAQYDSQTWQEGKAANKKALAEQVGLPHREDVPLIGLVGRLADQKGFDLVAQILPHWAEHEEVQWVMLGTGEERYHDLLRGLAERFPEKLAVRLEFSEELAHRIEAASDMFLMPSRYEPCGLSQLYSLRYGAVPIVHATGGLADTITNAWEGTVQAGTANGISFDDYAASALDNAIRRAHEAYVDRSVWEQLVTTGMQQDWSWNRSARDYIELYQQTVTRMKQTLCA